MKRIQVTLTGITPLLHHRMPEEDVMALLGSKTVKKKEKEIKTPREIAQRHAYVSTDGQFCIPSSYLSGALISVASDYKQKNSAKKSLKGVIAGVVVPETEFAMLTDEKGQAIKDFEVDIKKGTNHRAGAVAICRPRFDKWQTSIVIRLNEDLVSMETLHNLLNDAGTRSGIGSFRVQKGGYYGQFQVREFKELT